MTESIQQLLARVSEILARAEKTPTGPWFWRKCYQLDTFDGLSRLWALKNEENPERIISIRGGLAHDYFTSPAQWHADPVNQFIAAARSDIPALCDAVRELANLLGESFVILEGLRLGVDWELAPAIKAAISELCPKILAALPSPPQEAQEIKK